MQNIIELTEQLQKSTSEYRRVQKDFFECKKTFNEHKFSLDSYEKAEFAEEFQIYADELEELQKDIDECLYWLNI